MEELISQAPPTPDTYFWYALSVSLVGTLIWILHRYITKIDRLFEELTKNIHELMLISKVHENRITNAEGDIEELKERVNL